MLLKKSTAVNLTFFATDSSDHISGKTGLSSFTVYICKNGASAILITPTITEISAANMPGWYNVVVSTTDVSVLGDLAYHITATGADPIDFVRQVVEDLPGAASYATTCADALLTRDWTSVSGEAARSVLNALRFLRNKWTLSGSTLSVKKEDDATEAWNAATTNTAGADPVTGVDPT